MIFAIFPPITLVLSLLVYGGALFRKGGHQPALWLNTAAFTIAVAAALMSAGLGGVQLQTLGQQLWPQTAGYVQPVTILVTFLGVILVKFSNNYLAGEPRRGQYFSHLQLTLGSVLLVVLANHLAQVIVGWIAISLALHNLLLFFPHRPHAVLAAHKKFLFARTAETLLVAGSVLLYLDYGTWDLPTLLTALETTEPGLLAQIAAVLFAMVAIIKCAQLPAHGWLIQVVEAPTPVSALLHAGVINLGGILLMLFAPLLVQVPTAQWLLLVIAGITTLIAALVMTVEVSIKARLAWSTSAQMGLMLVECALGLYQLALLHLLAHSCYKAYVFLSAGATVHRAGLVNPTDAQPAGGLSWICSLVLAGMITGLAAWIFGEATPLSPWLLLAALLTLLLVETSSRGNARTMLAAAAVAMTLVAAFSLQKLMATAIVTPAATAPLSGMDLWISGLVLSLLLINGVLREFPVHAMTRSLKTHLYAGLYLDELVTRITLQIWPVPFPKRPRFSTTRGPHWPTANPTPTQEGF